MGYTDLSFPAQIILIGVLIVVWSALLVRSAIFFRLERAGIPPLYPDSWNVTQRRTLERFRLLIGLALVPLWVLYLFVVPSMPKNWPFGFVEALSLISMLSVSYAWALLLAARDWKGLEEFPRSFLMLIAFLVIWWGFAFTAIGWLFAEATTQRPSLLFSTSTYAELQLPPLIQATGYFSPVHKFAK